MQKPEYTTGYQTQMLLSQKEILELKKGGLVPETMQLQPTFMFSIYHKAEARIIQLAIQVINANLHIYEIDIIFWYNITSYKCWTGKGEKGKEKNYERNISNQSTFIANSKT